MIDFYNHLPDVMIFMHSERYQWHNDDPIYGKWRVSYQTGEDMIADRGLDGVPLLQNLQLPYIISEGYVNLRCVWAFGCPSELRLNLDQHNEADRAFKTPQAYPQAFQELFPGEKVPSAVGVACCSQFALTSERIRERPLEDYQRYRQWLLDTPLENYTSGRVFEYSLHIIFGRPPVHCPSAKDCYCNAFGLCNLECEGDNRCGERWPFPPHARLPKEWPMIGWDREIRDQESLELLRHVATPPTKEVGRNDLQTASTPYSSHRA